MAINKKLMCVCLLYISFANAEVMNLNEFMPTRLEDANVMDAETKEVQLSTHFDKENTDGLHYRAVGRVSPLKDLQLEAMTDLYSGGNEEGSGQIQLGGQYAVLPYLGISPMFILPTGKRSDGIDTHLRFNISPTLVGSYNAPRTQLHINIDWAHNSSRQTNERTDHNFYAIGLSHQYSDSGALIVDIFREMTQEKGVEYNMLELGTQYDVGLRHFVGIGAGIGFGDESPKWHGIISLIKQL